jgi:ribosomal protein L35AE/L33A
MKLKVSAGSRLLILLIGCYVGVCGYEIFGSVSDRFSQKSAVSVRFSKNIDGFWFGFGSVLKIIVFSNKTQISA